MVVVDMVAEDTVVLVDMEEVEFLMQGQIHPQNLPN